MIIGIGIDQIEVDRVARKLDDDAFMTKVFAPSELAYCRSRGVPAQSFAARFAAKEALLKALGKGLFDGIDIVDIVVETDESGQPSIQLVESASAAVRDLGQIRIHLSLTHLKDIASAFVVVENSLSL